MHASTHKKLTLAAGSVFFHAAIIGWIFFGQGSKLIGLQNPQQPTISVFIVSPPSLQTPEPAPKITSIKAAPIAVLMTPPSTSRQQQTPIASEITSPFYFPVNLLDRGPLPKSEPDLLHINEKSVTNRPIKLRIYIDRFGKVDNVATLIADELDDDFARAAAEIFRATVFLPGRMQGVDVATFIDIEVNDVSVLPFPLPSPNIASVPCTACIDPDGAITTAEK